MPRPFRLAQITDLHLRHHLPGGSSISARRSRLMPDLFAQALEALQSEQVDFLAVTGDLLDAPHYAIRGDDYHDYHLDLCHEEAKRDYKLIKSLLDGCGIPYAVLPGNHDWEAPMWQVFPREPHVWEVEGHLIARFCDREHEGNVPRRFDRERKLFLQLLNGDSTLPQIHLQHYVVTPELNEGYPHTYLEGQELRDRAVRSGRVRLSLSGHYHAGTELTRVDDCCFAVGPAFAEFPHAYRIYEVHADGVELAQTALLDCPSAAGRPVVFLDRDGTINTLPAYTTGPEEMELLPGAAAALRRLREAGYALVVISTQSCVGAGHVSREMLNAVNDQLQRLLWQEGAWLDAVYCSHGAGERAVHLRYVSLEDAKPGPHYLHQAAKELGVDLSHAWMVGDSAGDIGAARNADVKPILVRTGNGRRTEANGCEAPVVDSLVEAVGLILS